MATHDNGNNRIQYIQDNLPTNGKYSQRPLDNIHAIVLHHSAALREKGFTPLDFAKWHIDTAGRLKAPGIAYHYVIGNNGEIFKTNDLMNVSWHAGNKTMNYHSIGICVMGDFTKEVPSAVQVEALEWLIQELSFDFGRKFKIYGHCEVSKHKTTCPASLDYRNLREKYGSE